MKRATDSEQDSYRRIRFVGGPWHNRFSVLPERIDKLMVPEIPERPLKCWLGPKDFKPAKIVTYRLQKMVTGHGTIFFEMHEDS